MRKKLLSNAVYLFFDWLFLSLAGFLFWFISGKTLLPEEYGIVSTSVNFSILLSGIGLFGLGVATYKLIPEFLEKNEKGKIISLIRFSLRIVFFSNLLILFIVMAFSGFLSSIIKVPISVIWILGVTVFIISFSSQFGNILYGFQDMKKFLFSDSIGLFVKVLFTALLIFLGFRYFGPLIGFLLGFVVTAFLRMTLIPMKGKVEKIDQKEVLLEYALPAFVSGIMSAILINSQYVFLTILSGTKATGIYAIAAVLTIPIVAIPLTLTSALFPIISQLSAYTNQKKRQQYLIKLIFRYSLFISLPIAIFLLVFSKQAILLFSGPDYLQASQLFPILVLAAIIYSCGSVFHQSLYAIGKPKISRNIIVLTAIIFLFLIIPLTYKFAAVGTAITYAISMTVLTSFSFFYLRRFLKVSLPLRSMLKIILSSLVSLSFLYGITYFITGFLVQIIFALLAGIIYLLILVPIGFYVDEDVKILEFAAERFPLFKRQISFLVKFLSKYT